MARLALRGGSPVREGPFPRYVTIGDEEKRAVMEVLDGGVLSQYLGAWCPDFYGGPRVRKLEQEWAQYFEVRHAVCVNSATSGLYAAVGAAGVGPGDEVVVSPYTMSASATAALVYGGIPIFADIDPETFCLTAETIRERLSPRTRAVIVVDLFGQPADMDPIMDLARDRGLVVIEDAAQAPGALYKKRRAGTLGHIGVFSLNYHKTIHCGEGGVITTDDGSLAERLQLIRNHGEAVVKAKGVTDTVNMIGFNFRMTEIEAAIASEQLKKLEALVRPRVTAADYLTKRLGGLAALHPPVVGKDIRHGYYLYALKYEESRTHVARARLAEAVRAEGVPLVEGYVEPLYLQPVYQNRIAFGRDGFPFTYPGYRGTPRYERGLCPVAERMHFEELLYTNICHAGVTDADLDDAVAAFCKIFENLDELRS